MNLAWVVTQLRWYAAFPQNDESLRKPFFVYSLWSLLPTTVVGGDQIRLSQLPEPITSFILREDSAVSTAYFTLHFLPVIMAGCALFTSGSTVAQHLEKSCFTKFKFSASDFMGSFSFIDELYNATFVKDLGTPNHFFRNLLIKRSIFSILGSDTSYICIGYANLGIKPK